MRWLWIVLIVLVAVPLLLVLIGSLLPRNHVARVTLELKSPPARVWSLVSDVAATPRWRKDVREVTVETRAGGPLRFTEKSKQGSVPFEVVSQEAPRRQVIRIVDDEQPFGGTWTWDLEPAGQGARLTITEAGFIKNPIFRVMSKLFFPPTATMQTYLQQLARELGE